MSVNLPQNINLSVPPQIKNYQNYIIEIVLLIIAAALFYFFLITPIQGKISLKQDNLAKIQTEEAKISDTLSKLEKMVREVKNHPQEIAQLDQAIPLDGKTPKLQMLLEKLASSLGVTVGNINIATGAAGEIWAGDKKILDNPYGVSRTPKKMTGSIYIIGNYDQLRSFLEKLEGNGRVFNITEFSLSGGENGNLNLNLSFEVSYLTP